MIKNCFKIILEWYFLPSRNVEDLPCAGLCSLPKLPPHQRFAHGVFAAWLLLGCCVQCCLWEKKKQNPKNRTHVGIRVHLSPAQPLPTPWRGFWGRTISSMVWGIEHGLVLRSAFTADRFLSYLWSLFSLVVMSVQQMCVKTKFCAFWALEVFHVLLAALCVCEGTTWLFPWLCNLIKII